LIDDVGAILPLNKQDMLLVSGLIASQATVKKRADAANNMTDILRLLYPNFAIIDYRLKGATGRFSKANVIKKLSSEQILSRLKFLLQREIELQ